MEAFLVWLQTDIGSVVQTALSIMFILVVMFLLVALVKKLFRKWINRQAEKGQKDQLTVLTLVRHIVVGLLYFFGAMAIIGQIPSLSQIATSLLAGSGILAVALSLAAQSSVSNLVSGALIGLFKPFRVGDVVRYLEGDVTGTVEEITLRHTVIRTAENKRLIIPNDIINNKVIENASISDNKVCQFIAVTVSYEADLKVAMGLLRQIVREHPDYLDARSSEEIAAGAPAVLVRAAELQEAGVLLRASVWAKDGGTAVQMKSDLLCAIKEKFAMQGMEIAYPRRMLVVKSTADMQPEKSAETIDAEIDTTPSDLT